jgi:hypothetical protein
MRVATRLMAQVMTRGKVKSKLISERKWVICSQAPGVVPNYNRVCSSSTKRWLARRELFVRVCRA